MKNHILYKDFFGSVAFSADDQVFFGKIEGIHDLVTFEGESVAELTQAFREAVDDYVAFCKQAGKDPEKSYKGSFNVRIDPRLHKKAAHSASLQGISLNQFIQKAVEHEVALDPKS